MLNLTRALPALAPAAIVWLTSGCSSPSPLEVLADTEEAAFAQPLAVYDATEVTHQIVSRAGTPYATSFGFGAHSGGYGNGFSPYWKPQENIAAPPNGRGWQSSIRDALHDGRHNPTQAGFNQCGGAPAALVAQASSTTPGGQRYKINKFPALLWRQDSFDFVENEEVTADPNANDNGNSDADGIDESNRTQIDEVKSEFDYRGFYEDASGLVQNPAVSVLRHYFFYSFARNPDAIKQFASLIDTSCRITDASRLFPTDQTPRNVDYSYLDVAYGIRVVTMSGPNYSQPTGLSTMFWRHEDGSLEAINIATTIDGDEPWVRLFEDQDNGYEAVSGKELCIGGPFEPNAKYDGRSTTNALLMLADGSDPATAKAVGIYYPQGSQLNAQPIRGINSNGNVVYREDRRIRMKGLGGKRGNAAPESCPESWTGGEWWNEEYHIRFHLYHTGMLAPSHSVFNAGGAAAPAVYEEVGTELYIIVGTPNQIAVAADEIASKLNTIPY